MFLITAPFLLGMECSSKLFCTTYCCVGLAWFCFGKARILYTSTPHLHDCKPRRSIRVPHCIDPSALRVACRPPHFKHNLHCPNRCQNLASQCLDDKMVGKEFAHHGPSNNSSSQKRGQFVGNHNILTLAPRSFHSIDILEWLPWHIAETTIW